MIPNRIGVDDRNRPVSADPQAIRLASMNQGIGAAKFEFIEPILEKLPRDRALVGGTTFGFGGRGTEKDVSAVGIEIQRFCGRCQEISHKGN